jgi:non-canonical poly(A) RNA polymerase PAPD5/7
MDDYDRYPPRDRSPPRRGDDYREFSFRSNVQGPQFPPPPQNSSDPRRRFDTRQQHNGQRYGRNGFRKSFPATHDRPILKALQDGSRTPERLSGMADVPSRFKDLAELSESMDESESDTDAEGDVPRKRQKTEASQPIVTAKWSNPDPYTVLPPTGEQVRAKKTDVVQLIRKAKSAAAEASLAAKNDIAGNIDFISLDLGLDLDESLEPGEVVGRGVDRSPLRTDDFNEIVVIEDAQDKQSHRPNNGLRSSHVDPALSVSNIGKPNATPENAGQIPYVVSRQDSNIGSVDQIPLPPKPILLPPPLPPLLPHPPTAPTGPREFRKRKLEQITSVEDGDVTQDWRAAGKRSSTPWVTVDHSATKDMGFW